MAMGNGGQISKDVSTGVVVLQGIRRCRRWGDAMMISRHLRHTGTWASVVQSQSDFTEDLRVHSSLYKSNISRRRSSGSTSIVTWAKPAQSVGVAGHLRNKTYIN